MISSYFINYGVFSAFLLLTLMETGVALLAVIDYEKYKPAIMKYIVPIWEINGTFIAFYLVNLEITYPHLITLVGTIYIGPVMAALIIFMAHNAYIAYSEYIGKKDPERRYMMVYGVSMLLVAFIAVSVLASSISGISINVASMTINLPAMFINGFSLVYFVAVVLITTGVSAIFFGVKSRIRYLPSALFVAGILIMWGITAVYVPYIVSHFSTAFEYVLIIVAAFIAANYAASRGKARTGRILALAATYSSIMYYGLLEYPYFFGKRVYVGSLLNSSVMTGYANIVTAVGGTLLGLGMLLFAYYSYIKPDNADTKGTGS